MLSLYTSLCNLACPFCIKRCQWWGASHLDTEKQNSCSCDGTACTIKQIQVIINYFPTPYPIIISISIHLLPAPITPNPRPKHTHTLTLWPTFELELFTDVDILISELNAVVFNVHFWLRQQLLLYTETVASHSDCGFTLRLWLHTQTAASHSNSGFTLRRWLHTQTAAAASHSDSGFTLRQRLALISNKCRECFSWFNHSCWREKVHWNNAETSHHRLMSKARQQNIMYSYLLI
jgi:hypothetical protein